MHDASKFNLSISGFSGIPQVHSFELSEGILGDDQLAVHFITSSNPSGSMVGSEASFSFEHEGKEEFFSGVITSCRIKQSASGISTVALAVKTLRHLLDREKKRAVFCDSDVEEIAKKILGKARILNVRCDLKSFYKTDLKVQHNESDLAFLQRLFEECGIAEYVRHSGKGSELVISDSNDFEASDPSFADSELETTESGNVFHGSGHVPVRPGVEFEAFGETFVVCSASHSGSQRAAYGVETESEGYSCHVTAYSKSALGSLPGRRQPPLHSPGVMQATVEGFSDSPAYLDSEGRYIIRLPFDVESQDMASSIPVHLMQNFAGEGGGIHFPLRKDTPVLVAFEDGSMEKPVILGAIPRDTHRSPSTEDNSFQNVVRTSSGIELVFDDKAKSLGISAPEGVSAKAGKEMILEGGERLTLAGGKVRISLDGSSGALMIDASDIAVKSKGKIALQGDTIEIGGPSSPGPDAGAGSAAGASSLQRQATGSGGSSNSVVPQGMAPQNMTMSVDPQNMAKGVALQGALFVKEVKGAKETYPRQRIVYKAELSKKRSEMSDYDKSKAIKWFVKAGNAEEKLLFYGADEITLDIDKDWENEDFILVMACIGDTRKASWETKMLKETSNKTLIRGVVGEDEAFTGQKIEYKATNSNKDGEDGKAESVKGNKDIKWAIKVGEDGKINKDMLKDREGEELTLKIKEEWAADKEITVMPYLNSPTETVSVKTRVEKFPTLPILIAWSRQQPGKNEDGTEARDMHCGDKKKENILGMFARTSAGVIYNAITFEDADAHFKGFKEMATTFFAKNNIELYKPIFPEELSEPVSLSTEAVVNLESNIIKMIEHFRSKDGEDYFDPDLTTAVMCHEETIRFFNDIRNNLESGLKEYKGNLIKVKEAWEELIEYGDPIRQPAYSSWTDIFQGLTIAVNDTWAYKVWITEYKLEDDGNYKGKIKIAIYDHFGLDDDDVGFMKAAQYIDGFYDWYTLQHWEGFNKKYKPFITVIEKELPFKGKL